MTETIYYENDNFVVFSSPSHGSVWSVIAQTKGEEPRNVFWLRIEDETRAKEAAAEMAYHLGFRG